jgi:hypothetical protein
MLLPIDATAGAILAATQMPSLARRDFAISFGGGFLPFRSGLLALQPSGFAPIELAAIHAPTDARLLALLASVNSWRSLRH